MEPEILPPRTGGRGSANADFDSIFIRVTQGDDGIRRIHLKKPGPFTIALLLLAAGLGVAILFLLLSALMLLWVPLVIAGILLALLSGSLGGVWQRVRGWFGR